MAQLLVQVLETFIIIAALVAINLAARFIVQRKLMGLEGHEYLVRFIWLIVAIAGIAYLSVIWEIISLILGTVATIGALAIIIGIAVMPWLSDIIVGVTLYINPLIRVGSEIEIGGMRGRISRMNLTTTQITANEALIIIPNRKFREELVMIISTKEISD
ncbi:MAG: mechanosensitive ion channel [Thaumarchaeota archaeon]|nr:mechanosensitive ion channel [Nitrososphaerota archaeon]